MSTSSSNSDTDTSRQEDIQQLLNKLKVEAQYQAMQRILSNPQAHIARQVRTKQLKRELYIAQMHAIVNGKYY